MKNYKNKNGFTLIELMVTVGIVGILAAVALPAYQDYTIRAQVTEGITLASGVKAAMVEYHANHGEYPSNNAQLGYGGANGNYVESVNVNANGHIYAQFNNNANANLAGKVVILTVEDTQGDIELSKNNYGSIFASIFMVSNSFAQKTDWHCYSNVEQKYLPTSCLSKDISINSGNEGNAPNEPEEPVTPPENALTVASPNNPNVNGKINNIPQMWGPNVVFYGKYGNTTINADGTYTYRLQKDLYDMFDSHDDEVAEYFYVEDGVTKKGFINIEVK